MAEFPMPKVHDNPTSWGPPPDFNFEEWGVLSFNVEHLEKYPISRIGRVCDFTAAGQRYAEQRAAKGKGKGKGGPVIVAGKDEENFTLVDNRPAPPAKGKGKSGGKSGGKGKGASRKDDGYQQGILGQKTKPFFGGKAQQQKGKGKGKKGSARGMPSFKEWSLQTKTEWTMIQEITLSSMGKLATNAKLVEVKDLRWCGILHQYNRDFDRITIKQDKPMRRFEDLNFFNVSTSDDPHLPDFLQEDDSITAIATDHVLACLIAANRSNYSWDIVITKINDKLIFDKRDGSHIDFLTVNETAADPPNVDDKEVINTPVRLGQEASCINQNFSQMVLDLREDAEEMDNPNPFEDEDDQEESHAASGAYRYRKFTLPGDPKSDTEFNQKPVSLVVRTEVNCKQANPGGSDTYIAVKALNEYNTIVNAANSTSWRGHLESQAGAVLATEIKNNSFKIARWVVQAMLGGCDTMKVGYVSRHTASDPWNHTILGVRTQMTDSFAESALGMNKNNVYGIIRSIIDLMAGMPNGKYVLLKDPMKPVIRLYDVAWDNFGEEDEEDEEEVDEPELDDDGNVLPVQQEGVIPAAKQMW